MEVDMSIYAIADLHLSLQTEKPMNIFGENWNKHEEKIRKDWLKKVKEEDTILLPGDFSWAISVKDTYKDFEYLSNLPGRKIMLKGNHDYWWNSLKKLNEFIKENGFKNIEFLQNNSEEVEGKIIAGTRGWSFGDSEEDLKILNREAIRLEMSIQDGIKKYGKDKEIIICMHYPPTNKKLLGESIFINIMQKYNVKKCIYGHLHGDVTQNEKVEGNIEEIELILVSSDYLDFKLKKIMEPK